MIAPYSVIMSCVHCPPVGLLSPTTSIRDFRPGRYCVLAAITSDSPGVGARPVHGSAADLHVDLNSPAVVLVVARHAIYDVSRDWPAARIERPAISNFPQ